MKQKSQNEEILDYSNSLMILESCPTYNQTYKDVIDISPAHIMPVLDGFLHQINYLCSLGVYLNE